MNCKKFIVGFVIVCSIVLLGWKISTYSSVSHQQVSSESRVRVVLNFGDSIATYDDIPAGTVLDGLVVASKKKNLELKTKRYDFGIFVESIGDKTNTKDKAWIYYVNGVSGDVASDKKTVKNGDVIEWRYTKPIY